MALTRGRLGRIAYGALFVVVLPVLLAWWARRLDAVLTLPAYRAPAAGAAVAILGLGLMAWGAVALWRYGGGLPMSAYPPGHYVTRGPYALLRHPLYVGAVLATAGIAITVGSGAGLFLVTPVLAALATAWVIGFEGALTRERFGAPPPLWLHLASADDARPSFGERAFSLTHLFVPWLLLYYGVESLRVPHDAIEAWTRWDAPWPVLAWTESVYFGAYAFVGAAPLVAATRRDLRWFITRGWLAMACIVPLWLLLPIVATAKAAPAGGVLGDLMEWERAWDAPLTAFPSFHATWAALAAVVLARRWPMTAWVWWLIALAIGASCVTTGMHATADVVAGFAVAWLVARSAPIWEAARRWAERVANSWSEATLGPVRFLSHSTWAAAGAWCGLAIVLALAGAGALLPAIGVTVASIVGAALWAQVVEGSPQLLRPYGYYGSALFASIGFVVADLLGYDGWRLAAAFAVGGSVTQAIGRGRCLVQGCCHGRACAPWLGIRITHPRSRVARLSTLGGTPVHPTQVYSMAWMMLVAAVLLRLWTLHAPLPFVAGSYFVLVGLGRFVEEHFRGEPQTAVIGGLRLYQWLAIACVVGGAAMTTLPGVPAPPLSVPPTGALAALAVFSLFVYAAYGVDFPQLDTRLSRLV
jgi:protein-S-isoprenylcysteine O-methyltransferase Ste14/membrane-associated phospholipid phosphatase